MCRVGSDRVGVDPNQNYGRGKSLIKIPYPHCDFIAFQFFHPSRYSNQYAADCLQYEMGD